MKLLNNKFSVFIIILIWIISTIVYKVGKDQIEQFQLREDVKIILGPQGKFLPISTDITFSIDKSNINNNIYYLHRELNKESMQNLAYLMNSDILISSNDHSHDWQLPQEIRQIQWNINNSDFSAKGYIGNSFIMMRWRDNEAYFIVKKASRPISDSIKDGQMTALSDSDKIDQKPFVHPYLKPVPHVDQVYYELVPDPNETSGCIDSSKCQQVD